MMNVQAQCAACVVMQCHCPGVEHPLCCSSCAELLTQASRLMMLDIVRIVFARLPDLPPSAPRPDSDALHPLRNGPPAIPAGESLIEHSPAEPDTGQQQSNGEPDAAAAGGGETKPLLDGAADAPVAQPEAHAAAAAAPASQIQLPRPDSTGWNAAGAQQRCTMDT